jgi:hypothetical protein
MSWSKNIFYEHACKKSFLILHNSKTHNARLPWKVRNLSVVCSTPTEFLRRIYN